MPGNTETPADDERQAPTFPPGYFLDMLAEEYDFLLFARFMEGLADGLRILQGLEPRRRVTIVESTMPSRKTPQHLLSASQGPFVRYRGTTPAKSLHELGNTFGPFGFFYQQRGAICPYCGLKLFPGADPEACMMKEQMERAARAAVVRAIFTRVEQRRRAWVLDFIQQVGFL